MSRIEDARLEKWAQIVCGQTHYEGFQCHICERREMARELIERRRSDALTERLRKALEEASDEFDHLIHEGMSFDPDFLIEIRAALAEASREKEP